MNAGYSPTPLAKKLGLKPNYRVMLIHPPSHYTDLFSDWPDGVVEVKAPAPESLDFIHYFCTTYEVLEQSEHYIPFMKKEGLLWVSWPKGSSKIPTNLKRDLIRTFLLRTELVDVKVAAIDEDWSGLKFVYRLKNRVV